LQTEFDPMEIDPLYIGDYLLYYYYVELPEFLDRRRN
jgi:hypothetical protein